MCGFDSHLRHQSSLQLSEHGRREAHTPLCDRLGIRYPICQAGMAFVARANLAAAVSAAGGLGGHRGRARDASDLRDEIRRVRDLTDKPFGVDMLCATVRAAGREAERFTDAVKGWRSTAD
ncbi:MAG: nitronate monooxygenase [Candidatus Rokuibacteriota bacterium]